MGIRRRFEPESDFDRMLSRIPDSLLDLSPYLVRGLDGYREWLLAVAGAAGLVGGAADDRLPALVAALGVDMKPLYLELFEQQRLRSFWSSHGRQ
jgi:hypothetical protein